MPARLTDPKRSAREREQTPDDLENYFLDGDENPFATPSPDGGKGGKKRKETAAGLGIDEQVEVKKRARVPRVKLDEDRLLSKDGMPLLRKKQRDVKLKGKGHEFSDAARLLSFYQHWLDDLFPKAKFLDALAMVEKLGHKTTLHKLRMDWINEGKPRESHDLFAENEAPHQAQSRPKDSATTSTQVPSLDTSTGERPKTPTAASGGGLFVDDDEDIYDATPRRQRQTVQPHPAANDEPDEDDLDALMAEAEQSRPAHGQVGTTAQSTTSIFGSGRSQIPGANPTDEPDEDDLDALMAEAEAVRSKGSMFGKGATTKELAVVDKEQDQDDLDALIAEAEAGPGTQGDTGHAPSNTANPETQKGQITEEEEAMAEMEGLW